ncbi:MAG: Zn-dependent oligopeptidase [Deltaproteobacteria bacterium]|nr:Zn-dependent oligopeptidase [Deltaproteobacteria bacterium]
MGRIIQFVWCVLLSAALAGCGVSHSGTQIDASKAIKVMLDEPPPDDSWRISGELVTPRMFRSAIEVSDFCDMGMKAAREYRDILVNKTDKRAYGALNQMNDLDASLDAFIPQMSLMANVHPDKSVRDAADKCREDAMALVTELSLDTEIFEVLESIDPSKLSAMGRRSLEKQLKAYRRSGVDRDDATRKQITEYQQALVKVEMDFSREIREGTRYVAFSVADLAGVPRDFIDAHPVDDTGTIRISTDYPDFFPVVNYANLEASRKAIYKAFLQRAWPANEENLKTMLKLRSQLAQTLGYSSWADYAAEMEMAHDAKTIGRFIDQVAEIARPRMTADLNELLARKRQDQPDADAIHVWDRFYYVNRIKAERFDIDLEALRTYFPYRNVVDGVLKINQLMFGVTFRQVPDADVWHSDVQAYDVFDGNQALGRFYLDMHPREGKYKHMAMFHVVEGIRDNRLPVGVLVCNFPKPDGHNAALMGHDDVVTLFHEFGHLMHHILAGGYPYLNLTGISCESEFVEAPSQLLEEWAYDPGVLAQFAHHVTTGEAIPESLVEKLRAARGFGRGIHVMRQMFYAAMSLEFHVASPDDLDLAALTRSLQESYSPYPFEPETYVYASFGHLTGYTSEYYSYMWSLKLAQDLLTRFKQEGMLNPSTAADYREFIIRRGGSVDAGDMVERFLGRAPTFDAFRKYLED